jgi:hypothetical protein
MSEDLLVSIASAAWTSQLKASTTSSAIPANLKLKTKESDNNDSFYILPERLKSMDFIPSWKNAVYNF